MHRMAHCLYDIWALGGFLHVNAPVVTVAKLVRVALFHQLKMILAAHDHIRAIIDALTVENELAFV